MRHDDAAGLKAIDGGIAKATQGRRTHVIVFTAFTHKSPSGLSKRPAARPPRSGPEPVAWFARCKRPNAVTAGLRSPPRSTNFRSE